MATSYSKNLVDKILPKIQQYEATTGRKVSRSMMNSLFRQELDVMAERDAQTRALDIQQQTLDLNKQTAADTKSANKAAGVTGAVSSAGQLYLGYKYLTKPDSGTYTGPDASATTGGFANGNTGTGPAFSEAPGAQPTTPAVGGQTAAATAPAYDAGGMAGYDAGYDAFAGGTSDAAAGSTTGSAATGATEGASATGSSALGTAGTTAAYAYAGYQASRLMQNKVAPWAKEHLGDNWEKHGFTFQPAALIGDAIGGKTGRTVANILDPAGNVLWGATSNVAEKTGTIICGELHRQGIITDRQRRHGMMFGKLVGEETYGGYLIAASPVVERMRKSWLYTMFIAFFALPAIAEISHRVNPKEEGSIFGSIVLHFGIPYCVRKYHEVYDIVAEVA